LQATAAAETSQQLAAAAVAQQQKDIGKVFVKPPATDPGYSVLW